MKMKFLSKIDWKITYLLIRNFSSLRNRPQESAKFFDTGHIRKIDLIDLIVSKTDQIFAGFYYELSIAKISPMYTSDWW